MHYLIYQNLKDVHTHFLEKLDITIWKNHEYTSIFLH